MLVLVSLAFARPNPVDAAPHARGAGELAAAFDGAAAEFGVPAPLLEAIAWEASRFDPDVRTQGGGYGLFDLREGDRDPALENAAALLEVDPNAMIDDWRLQVRGAAALLAAQGARSNGGRLPPGDDLMAWWNATRAFSGRDEPILQDQYTTFIYRTLEEGILADTAWGTLLVGPQRVDLTGRVAAPPPASTDSPLAYQFYAACSDNYSDYSRGASDIDMVVIHTVQGSYSGCYSWFSNCSAGASAHYVVRSSDGQITQMVDESDVAWHAGNWDVNLESIGIEHEGYVESPGTWYTDAMYASSAALVVDISDRLGVPLDRSHIIGHDEVPDPYNPGQYGGAGHHTDPGSGWDWDYFMELVNGETGTAGGEIVGVVADADIYNGTRLVGATVWIAETGEATTVASDGYYRFEDVPFGTYTMHATYPGYAEGTCTKTTSSSQDWCSIALYPDTSGGEDTGGGGQVDDTDAGTDDTGPGVEPGLADVEPGPPAMPGTPARMDEVGGCGCATGSGSGEGWLAAALALALRRRSRRA